jgi:hypothetical protein
VAVKAVGLSVQYPAAWLVLSYKGVSAAQQKSFAKATVPQVVAAAFSSISNDPATQFFAVDVSTGQSIFVGVARRPFPSSLKDFEIETSGMGTSTTAEVDNASSRPLGKKSAFQALTGKQAVGADGTPIERWGGELIFPRSAGLVAVVLVETGTDTAAPDRATTILYGTRAL